MSKETSNLLTSLVFIAVVAALVAVWTMAAPIAAKAALTAIVFGAIAAGVYRFGRKP